MSLEILAKSNESRLRELIADVGKSIFDRGLTAGSSGNISVRLDDGWLVTPTNASLGRLDPARISKLDWDGRLLNGDLPSKEAFLHRAMYEERSRAGAIIHLHSTYSAAVSCMDGLNEHDCMPPLTAYYVMKIGHLPLIPYYRPGDPALGEAIRGLAAKHCAVLLANHGPVVSGTTIETAVYAIEELEETAKLFLLLRNTPVRPLNAKEIEELEATFKTER
jgi:ribulose-5-phosphate 4-epimerase/fuculose-1-phosphate aldolase